MINIKYLFPVSPAVFYPPPRVQSAVIRLTRNERRDLPCDEQTFRRVVKAAFNQRRKTLRNSLKAAFSTEGLDPEILGLRPEQLDVQQFIDLTVAIESSKSL